MERSGSRRSWGRIGLNESGDIMGWATRIALLGLMMAVRPAAGRTIQFAGLTWTVRTGLGGPGPNNWSDSTQSVWVDAQGRLHMKIRQVAGVWFAAEITSVDSFGYGTYLFNIESNADLFDPNIVVGLFTFLDCNNEVDIEFSRWTNPFDVAGQYVTQPAISGNINRFDLAPAGSVSTHSFTWRPQSIFYQSYAGQHDALPPSVPATKVHDWLYTGPDIPVPSVERLHVNFWLVNGMPPSNGLEEEVVISNITFTNIPGDCNGDGQGDLNDVGLFELCLVGAGAPLDAGCECADLDGDNSADLADYAVLQQVLVGTCGDGVINAGEQCDPPDGAICDAQCQLMGCGPGAGSCFVANGTPGCDDPACCDLICASFPTCCSVDWDVNCAGFATSFCTP